LKLTTNGHEASRDLSAIAELLVMTLVPKFNSSSLRSSYSILIH